jgi:predicted peptidase
MRLLVLVVAGIFALAGNSEEKTDPFAAATFAAPDGTQLPYRLLRPPAVVPGKLYPLVVQLHGSGAIGTDNRAQIGAFSNGWLLPDARKNFAAFVLVPQFASRTVEYAEVSDPSRLRSRSLPPLATAFALVEQIAKQFPVDRTRIYITGFSMGASGALQAVMMRPDLFAAAVAIAPVPPDSTLGPSRPILILHGDADTENPFVASRAWFESMKPRAAGLEFRTYPGVQHEIPAEVLTSMWWREWLFSKRLVPKK